MTHSSDSDRRGFLTKSAKAGAALGLGSSIAPAISKARNAKVQSYRQLGRTGLKVSDISFGASRLREDGAHLVRHALDRGINYFDTAYRYTGGVSEQVIGKALAGSRQDVVLVSKYEGRASSSQARMMHELETSLKRLRTDYIDIYLAHAVNDVARLQSEEWLGFIEQAKADGKIRFSGMSGHAGKLINCLDYALDEDMADVILVAYNFGQDPAFYEKFTRSFNYVAVQTDLPRVLAKAKTKNVGVIAMKTLMGARLNDLRRYETPETTFSQAAFRWVLSNRDVDALIISMTSIEDIDEFLGASGAGELTSKDMELLFRYAKSNGMTYCHHACDDCTGACPYNVQISDVLRTRMYATDYRDKKFAQDEYALLETNAAACLTCSGEPCRNACTKGIAIDELCGPTHLMLT